MVNPFGEESDSIFAWKERYKQQQTQTHILQTRVSELKIALDSLMEKYELQTNEMIQAKEEFSQNKQELLTYKNATQEKLDQINQLERQVDQSGVERIQRENIDLKNKLEQLQAEYVRGSAVASEKVSAKITSTLTPLMLREFDPENEMYGNAFKDLVEAVIAEGDSIEKIIGTLIKYGGRGPLDNVKSLIHLPEFDVALDVLIEEGIVKRIDHEIMLVTTENSILTSARWDDMTVPDLFERMKDIVENEPDKVVIDSLAKFRDVLQDKNVPMTTMLFKIRKLIEGFQKRTINRSEAVEQIEEWRIKLVKPF